MRRRDFIALLGGTAIPWSLPLKAQQLGKPARIGVFGAATDNPVMGPAYRAFIDEMRRLGFDEAQNLIVEHRPTEQDLSVLSAAAKELARLKVDVLVALGAEPPLKACISASRTIPNCVRSQQFRSHSAGLCQKPRQARWERNGRFSTPD